MKMPLIQAWETKHMKKFSTPLRPGDSVKISVRVFEGEKERLQQFEGVVIRCQGAGLRETFTVRRTSFGVGIERTFPFASPVIEKIVISKRGRVRRAKLHYLREVTGREAKLDEIVDYVPAAPVAEAPAAPAVESEAPAPKPKAKPKAKAAASAK